MVALAGRREVRLSGSQPVTLYLYLSRVVGPTGRLGRGLTWERAAGVRAV